MSDQDVTDLIKNANNVVDEALPDNGKQRFTFQSGTDIDFQPDDDLFLIEGVIPQKGVVIAYGPTQTYKSFIMLDMAAGIAEADKQWGPFPIENQNSGKCIYVAAEGAGGIKKRLAGIKAHRENQLANLLLLSDRPILGLPKGGDTTELIAEMKALGKISMVVIDTLSQVLGGGDENGSGMQVVLAAATDISNELNCAVVLVHHTGHQGKDPRGHSSAMGNPDSLLQFEYDGHLRSRFTIRKQKDQESYKSFCAELQLQRLGCKTNGEMASTLIVKKITDAPLENGHKTKKLTRSQSLFMTVLKQVVREKHESIMIDEASSPVQAVELEHLRKNYYSRNSHKEPDAKRKGFGRAIDELIDLKLICSVEHQGKSYIYPRKEETSSSGD